MSPLVDSAITSSRRGVRAALAERRLQTSGYAELRDVTCYEEDNGLVLSGTVPSYFLKQLAQARVAQAVPDCPLVNLLTVRSSPRARQE